MPSVYINVQDFTNHVYCHNGMGYLHPIITDGLPPFEYTWYDENWNILSHSLNLDSVSAGWYYFEVRKDTMPEGTGAVWDGIMYNPDTIDITFHPSDVGGGFNVAVDGNNGSISKGVYFLKTKIRNEYCLQKIIIN